MYYTHFCFVRRWGRQVVIENVYARFVVRSGHYDECVVFAATYTLAVFRERWGGVLTGFTNPKRMTVIGNLSVWRNRLESHSVKDFLVIGKDVNRRISRSRVNHPHQCVVPFFSFLCRRRG